MSVETEPTTPAAVSRSNGLDVILGEVSRQVFLTEYLDRRFLPLRGSPSRFEHLLTWADLNHVLDTHMFSSATLRMKKAGLDVPVESYMTEYGMSNKSGVATKISSKAITRELREGATLLVNEIQKPWPPIGALVEDLEAALNARINVNMYVAFYESHGFACHYDCHDVFVLQVHGRKRWQVFDRRPVTPFPHEPFERAERPQLGDPLWEGILAQGDALYLPRGQWHFARPVGEPSLHLSVGIVHPTGLDVLTWLTRELGQGELLRRNVPQFAAPPEQEAYMASLRDALRAAIDRPELLAAFLRDRAVADGALSRPRFGLPWSALQATLPPSDDSVIHVAAPGRLLTYDAAGADDKVRLYVDGKPGPTFRRRVTALCDYLTRSAPVSIGRFVADFGGRFEESTLRAFVSELATVGLVVVEPARDASTASGAPRTA